jgi:hypothetical protein
LAFVLCLQPAVSAHAHSREAFKGISQASGASGLLAVSYLGSGGSEGLFLSHDGGAHFGLLCSRAIDKSVSGLELHVSGDGTIYLGLFAALWRGDSHGCGWQAVPELAGELVEALASDPIDPNVTYLVTASAAPKPNGIFVNHGDGSAWTALGSEDELFLNTIHVVKVGGERRIYETGFRYMDPITQMEIARYTVRVSDDQGASWTEHEFGAADQFGPEDKNAELKILAVDPTDADRIVAGVMRTGQENLPDDLVYSPAQGKAGTWVKIGQVTALQAVAFMPDGRLLYGDNDQDSPDLFRVDKLGEAPHKLSSSWKVACLQYDAAHNRMYACQTWTLGTVDIDTGAFTALFDMSAADSFVDCAGEEPVAARCEQQLLAAYCGLSHYEDAPVCSVYSRPWYMPPSAGGAGGAAELAGAGGAGAVAGRLAADGGAGGAGGLAVSGRSGPNAGTQTTVEARNGSGCACTTFGAAPEQVSGFAAWLGASLVGLRWARRRRR